MCMQWMVMMATILSPAVPKASPALTRALSIFFMILFGGYSFNVIHVLE